LRNPKRKPNKKLDEKLGKGEGEKEMEINPVGARREWKNFKSRKSRTAKGGIGSGKKKNEELRPRQKKKNAEK